MLSDNAATSVTAACSLQVLRAIKDGYDCRGIYIWTLVNNFVSTCSGAHASSTTLSSTELIF